MIGMFSCEVFDVIFPLIDSLLDSVAKQRIALTKSFWISRKRCSIIGNDEFDYAKFFYIIYSIIYSRNYWYYIQYYWYSELLILYSIQYYWYSELLILYTVLLILEIIDFIYSIIDTRNYWFYIPYYYYYYRLFTAEIDSLLGIFIPKAGHQKLSSNS